MRENPSSRYYAGLNSLPTIHRVEGRIQKDSPFSLNNSLNITRARTLKFKSIPGIFLVRVKVRRGMMRAPTINKKRKPRGMGMRKKSLNLNLRTIGEQRVQRRYPNCRVLSSFHVASSGQNKWFEVILVDPSNPNVASRKEYSHLLRRRGAPFRGLTTASRKSRNLSK